MFSIPHLKRGGGGNFIVFLNSSIAIRNDNSKTNGQMDKSSKGQLASSQEFKCSVEESEMLIKAWLKPTSNAQDSRLTFSQSLSEL